MATRLSAKHRKSRRDRSREFQENGGPKGYRDHKVAVERSKKALKKKACRSY